jgi:hypothetical protein
MKSKFILSLLCFAFIAMAATAQVVNRFNYQAIARNTSGGILATQAVSIRITIENGSGGPALYTETHLALTNQFGLFTLQIGAGTPITGTFSSIVWSNGNHWLKVDMDPTGGNSYTTMGESQLLSVPYANYAASGGTTYTAGTGINIASNVISNTGVTSVTAGTGLSGGTITTTGTISMPNVGTAGTYGSGTLVPVITTDAQGRVTNVTTASVSGSSYTGGTGITIVGSVINSVWTQSGNNIYNNNTANVGIGIITPGYLLHVNGSGTTATLSNNTSATGIGLTGQNNAGAGTGTGNGIFGATQQSSGFGVYAANLNPQGTGILGIGNNLATYTIPIDGAGGAFFGDLNGVYGFTAANTGYGVYGKATNATSAYGVIGTANNVAAAAPTSGDGGAFSGFNYGVSGYQTNGAASTQTAAGYFANTDPSTTLVEAWSAANTHYKIWQSNVGTVATCVPDLNGNAVTLHAAETPEFYFQDYGQAQLINGRAHINIDPVLAKNVTISERHPLRVFVQLEGDCNGVFVTNKTATGFDVVELNHGSSNVSFQWNITCNVADAQIGNRLSHFADIRFEPGPINEMHPLRDAQSQSRAVVGLQK